MSVDQDLAVRAIGSPDELCALLDIPFSDEQLKAICAPLEPGVIIAGAGTGKTTVMAARVVWLVATGQVRPDQVLGLTFTRKAAGELSQRVDAALAAAGLIDTAQGGDDGRQLVTTYDSFAASLVTDHGLRIGIDTGQILIAGATRYRLADQAVSRTKDELQDLACWQPATVTDRLLRLDGELRSHLVDSAQVLAEDAAFAHELEQVKPGPRGLRTKAVRDSLGTVGARAELLGLIDDYRGLKRERGFTDFADQMAQAVRVIEASPQVAAAIRQRFQVVLLDEYQDTSSAQARLLRGLFSDTVISDGRGFPVTAVGDPFQAIYGWRGAAPSNILQFCDDFPNRDGTPAARFTLGINRRSKPAILDVANALSAALCSDERLLGEGVTSQQRLLRSPDNNSGGVVRVASFDTWPEEVGWLAGQVLAAKQLDQVDRWSKIAVLTRTNSSIGAIYEALSSLDIPVEIVGLGGLLEVPEIAELVATLRLIDDVSANPEVVQLLSGRRWRIGPRDLAVIGDRAQELMAQARDEREEDGDGLDRVGGSLDPGRSVLENADPPSDALRTVGEQFDTGRPNSKKAGPSSDALGTVGEQFDPANQLCLMDAVEDLGSAPVSPEARTRLAAFSSELRDLRRHRDEPLPELVHQVIKASGIALEIASDKDSFASGRKRQLERFADAVGEYVDIDGDGALSGLLAWFDAERAEGQGLDQAVPSSDDSVKLLTVHRSKGLEWDLVFLPALCAEVFPSSRGTDNWTTQPAVLPSALRGDAQWVPQLSEVTTKQLNKGYSAELKAAQRQAEDRLIYVGVTRARNQLVASCHYWAPGRKKIKGPSDYFLTLRDAAGTRVEAEAEVSEDNPLLGVALRSPWPVPMDEAKLAGLREAADLVHEAGSAEILADADPDAREQGESWHALAQLLVSAERKRRRPQSEVVLPASISASALMLANRDRAGFAAQVLRPMPRPISRRTSVGTRFHEWLEHKFAMPALFDDSFDDEPTEEAPAGGYPDASDQLLRRLTEAFERGRYASRTPLRIEEPFILTVGDQQVRGRMDAVFETPDDADHDFQIVDWKTSDAPADPLQLSIYRMAWAKSLGIDPERVDAVFYHVLSDHIERPLLLDERSMSSLLAGLTTRDNLNP